MIKVNALGQVCPMPVIMTKNTLKEIKEGVVEVAVDNKISKENVEKFATQMNFSFFTKEENGNYYITITKTLNDSSKTNSEEENIVVVISSDKMGEGDPEFGHTLMKGFIYTLTEMDKLPKTIIFYNRGVFLTTVTEATVKDLKILESKGVEIISCGACCNFYHLEDKVSVGTITNMYTIVERQMNATKVVRP